MTPYHLAPLRRNAFTRGSAVNPGIQHEEGHFYA